MYFYTNATDISFQWDNRRTKVLDSRLIAIYIPLYTEPIQYVDYTGYGLAYIIKKVPTFTEALKKIATGNTYLKCEGA